MKLSPTAHLAYCTNIHPAESWEETFQVLQTHTLAVRDQLTNGSEPYAIGLRLSARAANELLEIDADQQPHRLHAFQAWLARENCYVFTINGFPYGDFHGTRVKENVYLPDWTSPERLAYTNQLAIILSKLLPEGIDGSISTLPGSFKAFDADESTMFSNLYQCAGFLELMSQSSGKDLHLGLEPEPLGYFENTEETLSFFQRFYAWAESIGFDTEIITQRIGINYDTCHFALEFENCRESLDAFRSAGIRISKIHLSSALAFDPTAPDTLQAIQAFEEPTYLHQVIVQDRPNELTRFPDIPQFFEALQTEQLHLKTPSEARCHFHIPLYAEPETPLKSTQSHAKDALDYLQHHPDFCTHFEIETYTWAVLPDALQTSIESQIAEEYAWVYKQSNVETDD